MEYFESLLLPSILNFHLPWYRYVDDVICLWPNDQDVHKFLTDVNSLVPTI